jgi:hypothetical protein
MIVCLLNAFYTGSNDSLITLVTKLYRPLLLEVCILTLKFIALGMLKVQSKSLHSNCWVSIGQNVSFIKHPVEKTLELLDLWVNYPFSWAHIIHGTLDRLPFCISPLGLISTEIQIYSWQIILTLWSLWIKLIQGIQIHFRKL